MSKVIDAVYENGVFRPLEPVLLPEGEHVQAHMPEQPPTLHTRLAALDAFEAVDEELTEEQWRCLRRLRNAVLGAEDVSSTYEWLPT
jgi:predicted DNA-binding antitoxin AbrB/MazE fold protein